MKKVLIAVFFMAAAAFCTGAAFGQAQLPQTIDVDVTFYDFHSDRSNPEFEQTQENGYGNRVFEGMVAPTLDADNKPQLGTAVYRNLGIAHWFREWNTYTTGPYSKGTNRAPVYNPAPGIRQQHDNEWNSNITIVNRNANVGHDTSFKNIKIPGKLQFTLSDRNTGMYQYDNSNFFPLDNATTPANFGREWQSDNGNSPSNHNYSFTMEFEYGFQVKSGMVFNFRGDDDVWVFIDKQLMLDLGGMHSALPGDFNVVDKLGAGAVGSRRTLRVFYVERHSSASNLRIQTNIVAPPTSINISETGHNGSGLVTGTITKPADEKKTLYSVIYDEGGNVMRPKTEDPNGYDCNHVTWTVTAPNGSVRTQTGCSIELADSANWGGQHTITVAYNNGVDPRVDKSVNMQVRALAPAEIRIQRDSTNKAASDNIYFNPGETDVPIYAVLYDKYGNYVGLANARSSQQAGNGGWHSNNRAPQWRSEDTTVATVNPVTGSRSNARREFMGEGSSGDLTVSFVVCGGTLGANVCDTLRATVSVGSKSEPSIAAGPNPFVPGSTKVSDVYPPGTPTYNLYKDVPGVQGGYGVLIAVEAAKALDEGRAGKYGRAYGKVVIYDAVGNIVLVDGLYKGRQDVNRPSYGFVWDGKNSKGRNVGPGTYLVRVIGKDADGSSLKVQKKVGVTNK